MAYFVVQFTRMAKLLKPRILQDVRHTDATVFNFISTQINLGSKRSLRVPVTVITKLTVVLLAIWYMVLGSVFAPTTQIFAANAGTTAEQRQELEKQLKELEDQIEQYENQIVGYQKQGSSLKNEVAKLTSKISKLRLQIKAVNLTLVQLSAKISEAQEKINSAEVSIEEKQDVLGELLRRIYQYDSSNLMEIFLANPRLSEFYGDVNNVTLLQGDLRKTINEITDLKNELEDQKDQYALAQADAKTIQEYQLSQQKESEQLAQQKNSLLSITKNQESRYQQLLKETKKTAAEIRSRIFSLLGGGEMTFEQAYNMAKIAESATGVRAAMILAVLDRESALGKNVGRCDYKTSMSPKNQVIFLDILKELNLATDAVKVSCANADGVYGGAMGPAQFIPSTWVLYKSRIEAITNRIPASPWNNADAFLATGLYLKDAGAAGGSLSQERIAAAKYYAGGNYKRFLWTYGEAVVSRAQKFEQDIAAITGA